MNNDIFSKYVNKDQEKIKQKGRKKLFSFPGHNGIKSILASTFILTHLQFHEIVMKVKKLTWRIQALLRLHGSLTTRFSKKHGFSKLKISAMFLNSTVFGKTFNRFCDFFVTFCEFSYERNEIIPNYFQIDFLFCLFPLRLI